MFACLGACVEVKTQFSRGGSPAFQFAEASLVILLLFCVSEVPDRVLGSEL